MLKHRFLRCNNETNGPAKFRRIYFKRLFARAALPVVGLKW